MIQQLLQHTAQARIRREFGWEGCEDGPNEALFPADASSELGEQGLGWMVDDFLDLERLNALATTDMESGHYGGLHGIDGTDVVVKRFFPFVYTGGHRGDNLVRQVTESSILRDLIANLAMERALEGDERYVAPRYLGHLMLDGVEGQPRRHYTLMSRLDIVGHEEYRALSQEEKDEDYRLRTGVKQHCLSALRMSGCRMMTAKFDINTHTGNIPMIIDEETGEKKIGVIDVETYFKWRRPVEGEEHIAYSVNDPHAPWLAVDRFDFAGREHPQAAAA